MVAPGRGSESIHWDLELHIVLKGITVIRVLIFEDLLLLLLVCQIAALPKGHWHCLCWACDMAGWGWLSKSPSWEKSCLPTWLRSSREFLRKKMFLLFMDSSHSTKHWKEKLYLRWMWISRISEDGWIIWLLWLAGQHIIWSHNFATRLDPECSKTEEVRRSCNHDSTRMLMTKLKKEKNYNLKDY